MQLPDRFANNYEYLSVLQNSISRKIIIELEYKNKNNEISKRSVEPIGLVFYAFSWHLIAWCHMRLEYRDFKLARILKVSYTDMPFVKKEHIELNDYIKELPVDF